MNYELLNQLQQKALGKDAYAVSQRDPADAKMDLLASLMHERMVALQAQNVGIAYPRTSRGISLDCIQYMISLRVRSEYRCALDKEGAPIDHPGNQSPLATPEQVRQFQRFSEDIGWISAKFSWRPITVSSLVRKGLQRNDPWVCHAYWIAENDIEQIQTHLVQTRPVLTAAQRTESFEDRRGGWPTIPLDWRQRQQL